MADRDFPPLQDKAALRRRLLDLAARPHAECDLAEAALIIAAESDPTLDFDGAMGEIERLADRARTRLHARDVRTPVEAAFVLSGLVYEDEGFQGNATDYYDPRNSYLHQVLKRRTGIPITLAIVYLEVARRAGVAARGVGFPGHFLVKHPGAPEAILDPFTGAVLTEEDCRTRLKTTLGDGQHDLAEHMAAATPLNILVRMLRNLKRIHMDGGQPMDALAACERILLLLPDQPEELRDRGLAYEQLDCFQEAASDFERSLNLAPNQPQAELLRTHIASLLERVARLN